MVYNVNNDRQQRLEALLVQLQRTYNSLVEDAKRLIAQRKGSLLQVRNHARYSIEGIYYHTRMAVSIRTEINGCLEAIERVASAALNDARRQLSSMWPYSIDERTQCDQAYRKLHRLEDLHDELVEMKEAFGAYVDNIRHYD